MDISVTINGLNAVAAANLIAQLGGLSAHATDPVQATIAHAPTPPPAAAAPAAPPPPAPPAPTAAANPLIASVTQAMQSYSAARGATGVQDARKVLAQVGCQRVSDATPEQLAWLAQAFANPAYVPA